MFASLSWVRIMRHSAAAAAIALVAVMLPAGSPLASDNDDAGNDGPAIWKATHINLGGGATVYLFGTVHILEPGQNWFTAKIRSRFAEAHTLALEMADIKGVGDEAQKLIRQLGAYPPRDSLANHVGERTFMRLQSTMSRLGAPPVALYRMRPWVALMVFSTHALAANGRILQYGADRSLHRLALVQKKRVIGLESMEAHLRTLADMPDPVQIEMLTNALNGLNKHDPIYKPLVSAWLSGRVGELGVLMEASMADGSPIVRQRILIDRNRNWIRPIERMLAGRGTYFVAAGAAHFAGADNVIELLRARGATVTRE